MCTITGKFTSFREDFFITDPTEVYTWGNNINFTLGHGGQQGRHHPELVDLFPRNGVYIKQVFLMYYTGTFLVGVCKGEKITKELSSVEDFSGKNSSWCLPLSPYLPAIPITITEIVILCFGEENRGFTQFTLDIWLVYH